MCFHSKQTKKAIEVINRFNAQIDKPELFNETASYNAFTFPHTPVITNKHPHIIQEFYWGLIPKWSKDEDIRTYTLNARLETIKEKPSFKDNISNRCIIITNGFYEWQWQDKTGKKKKKYELSTTNNELFTFAGLYSEWLNKQTGEIRNTYTIVTTEAQGIMKEIHNSKYRMPITLTQEREQDWLNGIEIMDFKNDTVEIMASSVDVK